jgi:NADPH:quinone reductase-like Zn-dependent oxidoreductase
LKPGDTVLVLGMIVLIPKEITILQSIGTGGVSLTALIFTKVAGAITIVTSSSDEKLQYVKSKFGADYTINYKTYPNWGAEVQGIAKG